jgi:charged multivesicular body protein 2A
MPLEWLFGKRMTPEEMLRKNQRALNKAMRDLDRERARMEQQEKKIITDIKKMAKEGQMVCRNVVLAHMRKNSLLLYLFTVL